MATKTKTLATTLAGLTEAEINTVAAELAVMDPIKAVQLAAGIVKSPGSLSAAEALGDGIYGLLKRVFG